MRRLLGVQYESARAEREGYAFKCVPFAGEAIRYLLSRRLEQAQDSFFGLLSNRQRDRAELLARLQRQ